MSNGISLISEDEKFIYEPLVNVQIVYRRARESLKAQWNRKYLKDDRTQIIDEQAVMNAMLAYGVISWRGIADPDDENKPAELTVENINRLPSWLLDELSFLIGGRKRGHIDIPLAVSPTGLNSN